MSGALLVALRSLRRTPAFTALALVAFALGLGLNTALFSALHTLLYAPLPLAEPERLVVVTQTHPDGAARPVAPANFLDWRREARSFDGLAAYHVTPKVLTGAGDAARFETAVVSSNFFDVLGASLLVGAAGDGADRRVLVSEALWRERWGSAADIVGRVVQLDGDTVEIAGVLPSTVALPPSAELWQFAPGDVPALRLGGVSEAAALRDARYLGVVGRLRRGVAIETARAEMTAIAARLAAEYPDANAGNGARVLPLAETLATAARPLLWVLVAAALSVLLLSNLNLANLFLARAARRRRDLAVRAALGASRGHLLGATLAEALLLAVGGALVGGVFALWAARALVVVLPDAALAGRRIEGSVEVWLVAVLLALLSAILAGGAAAWRGARAEPALALASARGSLGVDRVERGALRRGLVVGQAAIAVVLLTAALLLLQTLTRLGRASLGFDPAAVTTARLSLPTTPLDAAERRAILGQAVEAARALPGVESAAVIQKLPLAGAGFSSNIRVEGRAFASTESPDVSWRAVTPDYFATLRIPLRRGRGFGEEDRSGSAPVALVNETLARLLWPGEDPTGRRISTGLDGPAGVSGSWTTVIGVVGDTPQASVAQPVAPEMYRPLAQESRFGAESVRLVVRTSGPAGSAAAPGAEALRRVAEQVSPWLVVDQVQPLERIAGAALSRPRLVGRLVAVLAVLALTIATAGVHGVVALRVAERRREFAVRRALGAPSESLRRLVLRHGLAPVVAGAALGVAVSLAVLRLLGSLLYGVGAADPPSLATAALALVAAAAAACWLPARRAARIDPMQSLRHE